MSKRTGANLFMLLGAVVWGVAFVAQGNAMEHIGPFTLGAARFLLGAVVLLPVYLISKKRGAADDAPARDYIKAGVVVGTILFAGATLQQYGLVYSTAGKTSFITSLYMVMVPFAAHFIFKRRVGLRAFAAAFTALAGIFLLCASGGGGLNIGDVYTFVGAIFWAAQILAIEKYASGLDGFKFAMCEFLTCSALSAVCMLLFESPTAEGVSAAAGLIAYCGVLSVGVGFTAQIICIKYTDPFAASVIMSCESVFGALAGWLLAGEEMTLRQIIGCALVFAAVVAAQCPDKKPEASGEGRE